MLREIKIPAPLSNAQLAMGFATLNILIGVALWPSIEGKILLLIGLLIWGGLWILAREELRAKYFRGGIL
jgi:hypothetical protein